MPDIDPTTAALAVATVGIVLWLITQIAIARAVGRISREIDAKRAQTTSFVSTSLQSVQNATNAKFDEVQQLVGGFEARMTAQMPPNVHGEPADLKAEFTRQFAEIDR